MNREWNIMQIGIVTRNLDKCVKNMYDKFGIGPWRIRTYRSEDHLIQKAIIHNTECSDDMQFSYKVAVCWANNMQLEYIQPLSGNTCFAKWLDEHGEGIHHIKVKFSNDEMSEAIQETKDMGYGVLNAGHILQDWFHYPDVFDDIGFNLEFGNGMPVNGLPYTSYPEGIEF